MTDSTVRAAADMMQVVDLLLATSILILAAWALRRWRQARALLVGLVTVAAHGVVFHAATLAGAVLSPWVNLWSATLRAHIYAFLLVALDTSLSVGSATVTPDAGALYLHARTSTVTPWPTGGQLWIQTVSGVQKLYVKFGNGTVREIASA